MNKRFAFIGLVLLAIAGLWTACKDDVANTGVSVLDEDDMIIVLADTFLAKLFTMFYGWQG